MSAPLVLTTERQIVAALADDRLVPPPATGGGSTLALRAAMARFSCPADHAPRRAAVEALIESIDPATAAATAATRAALRLERASENGRALEVITELARPVAVEALALTLGAGDAELAGLVDDVDLIAGLIGRGAAPSGSADAAAGRLTNRFAVQPWGAVAAVSVLYQSMDATGALVATRVLAGTPIGPTVPIARTKRLAAVAFTLDGVPVLAGSTVDLELGVTGLWFGSGPHACPGRALADALAAAIVAAVSASGLPVDLGRTEVDGDRRPVAVWLAPPAGAGGQLP